MKERSGSKRRRSSKDEEKGRRRSRGEKEKERGREGRKESMRDVRRESMREVRGESTARRRRTDEEEAKRLSALVREESMQEKSKRRRREEKRVVSELSVSGSRREGRMSTVSRRQSSAQESGNRDTGERHSNDLVRTLVREMERQPSSMATVPMPKSLPSLAALGQTRAGKEPLGSFEGSQGSNKRDVDNPFHRSYSRVRENPVHEQREQKPSLTSLKKEQGFSQTPLEREERSRHSFRREPGQSLSSLKRERRLSLGSLTSEEPTGVVRLPPGEEQVDRLLQSLQLCSL